MAELAGEDSEDTIIPLLERAIAYLCLPRKSPPGGPSVIGMEFFGGGVSASATKTKVASLRGACMAAVAAKKRKNGPKTSAAGKTTTRKGTQAGPVTASVGEATALPSSASPSPPRQRPSTGGRTLRKVVSATNVKAAKSAAAKASAKAAELLLPWDADSLASLLSSHQALAATLLRLERSSKLAAAGSAPRENQRRSPSASASTDAEGVGAVDCGEGVDDHGDGAGDHHHRQKSEQSMELLRRADASLTVALAASGVAVRPVTPPFRTDPITAGSAPEATGIGSKNSESGITPVFGGAASPPRPPSSPSPQSTPQNMASGDEGGPLNSVADSGSPMFRANAVLPATPATVLIRDAGAEHNMIDREGTEASLAEPQGEDGAVSSTPPGGGGEGDDNCFPGQSKGEQEPRQRRRTRDGDITHSGDNSLLAAAGCGAEQSTTVTELYSMRCAAKEGLGLTGDAFEDCLAALAAAPGAPKLWAKAASLALQLGSDAERREKRSCKGASTKALSDKMAREVRQTSRRVGSKGTGFLAA